MELVNLGLSIKSLHKMRIATHNFPLVVVQLEYGSDLDDILGLDKLLGVVVKVEQRHQIHRTQHVLPNLGLSIKSLHRTSGLPGTQQTNSMG